MSGRVAVGARPTGLLRRLLRRGNRRRVLERPVERRPFRERWAGVGRRLLGAGKIAVALVFLAGVVWGARQALQHVVESPRFALRELRVSAVVHLSNDEVLQLAGVRLGDRLLSVDTDAVAARLSSHPWVVSVRVRRELPSALVIDISERRAVALATLGGMYLVDEAGHPFKRATMVEADGMVVLTGIDREQYNEKPVASEAAFHEALAIVAEMRSENGRPRPPVSEIHIDPAEGFSMFLRDGGAEIRLGRGGYAEKLRRLDDIVRASGLDGATALELVHLELDGERVPVRMAAGRERPAAERYLQRGSKIEVHSRRDQASPAQ